jgi:hypothetical protein
VYLVYVSFEPMRDYAGFGYASLIRLCFVGFGYASLDSVMHPLNLHVIMRDLVMPRCCFVEFGYVSFVFVVSVMFL